MWLPVLALLAGLALVVGGTAALSLPAAAIVAGAALCAFALLVDDGSGDG
jgi:hypothetical protein